MNMLERIVKLALLAALLISFGMSRFITPAHADPGDGCSIVQDVCKNNGNKCDSNHVCFSAPSDGSCTCQPLPEEQ
jgi:hypothetical protein